MRKKTYDFQRFKTIKSFGREIYNDDLTLKDALDEQINLKNKTYKFKKSTKPQTPPSQRKRKKRTDFSKCN